jgi:succinate dehydrogenase/fumarate reductase flavoprotein subunit
MDKVLTHRMGWETQNMLTVARCMAQAALARKESRGTHYRSDFPTTDDERFLGHISLQKLPEEIRQDFEPLRKRH